MNLDTRARRAADGVRASTRGVNPMGQITELKQEDTTRHRNANVLAALGVTVLLAGAGWFAVSQLRDGTEAVPAPPAPSPSDSTVTPVFEFAPGAAVGSKLRPRIETNAPEGWTVYADQGYVWMDADNQPLGMSIQIGGPVLYVYDPEKGRGVDVPDKACFGDPRATCSGYADWLRDHPSLTLLESDVVTLGSGTEAQRLVLRVNDDAPLAGGYDGVLLGYYDGIDTGQPWDEVAPGETFTEVVVMMKGGKTMVIKGVGATTPEEEAELAAALDTVLSNVDLPS